MDEHELLIEETLGAIKAEADGWEYEDYESSNNLVAHRMILSPWGSIYTYQVVADEGQIDHDRARKYFDKRTKESIEHFISRGFVS